MDYEDSPDVSCCECFKPVRCIIDQHELEIIPATGRSNLSITERSIDYNTERSVILDSIRSGIEALTARSRIADSPPYTQNNNTMQHIQGVSNPSQLFNTRQNIRTPPVPSINLGSIHRGPF